MTQKMSRFVTSRTTLKHELLIGRDVTRVLRTAKKRHAPIHAGMIFSMLRASADDIVPVLNLMTTYNLIQVSPHNTVVATRTPSKPRNDVDVLERNIMQMLVNGPLSATVIAWNLQTPIVNVYEGLRGLDRMGYVTLQEKSFMFIEMPGRIKMLMNGCVAGVRRLCGLFYHNA